LFRLGSDAPDSPRSDYLTALTMLDLAAGVMSATGADDIDNRLDTTVGELAATVRLTAGERARLRARLRWLLAAGCTATGLGRRIAVLSLPAREATGHVLIAVAAGGRTIPSATVAALARAYRMLGLDVDLVFPRLHQRCVGGGAPVRDSRLRTEDPVVVRCAGPGEFGHALPWSQPATPATHGIQLSQEMISRKITESEAAGTLLATIFIDDEPIQPVPATTAHLDRAHSALLRELATRTPWTRAEFAELAGRHGVLPDGALDLLNDVAFDIVGEPVCEGAGDLVVNNDVLGELLR
jgi:hypothetical protein